MKSIEEALGASDYNALSRAVDELEFAMSENYDAATVKSAFDGVAAWKAKLDKVVV